MGPTRAVAREKNDKAVEQALGGLRIVNYDLDSALGVARAQSQDLEDEASHRRSLLSALDAEIGAERNRINVLQRILASKQKQLRTAGVKAEYNRPEGSPPFHSKRSSMPPQNMEASPRTLSDPRAMALRAKLAQVDSQIAIHSVVVGPADECLKMGIDEVDYSESKFDEVMDSMQKRNAELELKLQAMREYEKELALLVSPIPED